MSKNNKEATISDLRDVIRVLTKVRESRSDNNIEMLDETSLKSHFLDIVSASATKSGSEVELIDPFQLTNRRNKLL